MFAKMSLRVRVLTLGVVLTLVPMAVVSAVVYWQNREMIDAAKAESTKLAYAELDHIVQGVYHMCTAQQELLEEKVKADLNVADDVFNRMGQVSYASEKISWEAVNQFDHNVTRIELPKMLL